MQTVLRMLAPEVGEIVQRTEDAGRRDLRVVRNRHCQRRRQQGMRHSIQIFRRHQRIDGDEDRVLLVGCRPQQKLVDARFPEYGVVGCWVKSGGHRPDCEMLERTLAANGEAELPDRIDHRLDHVAADDDVRGPGQPVEGGQMEMVRVFVRKKNRCERRQLRAGYAPWRINLYAVSGPEAIRQDRIDQDVGGAVRDQPALMAEEGQLHRYPSRRRCRRGG